MTESVKKFSRRTVALFWCLGVAVLIMTLLYFEQVAVIYVIATLALVALLLIVANADLEKVGRENVAGFADDKKVAEARPK